MSCFDISHNIRRILTTSLMTWFTACAFLFMSGEAWACSQCLTIVKANVYNQDFIAHLLLLFLPLFILCAIGLVIHYSDVLLLKFSRTILTLRQFKGARK